MATQKKNTKAKANTVTPKSANKKTKPVQDKRASRVILFTGSVSAAIFAFYVGYAVFRGLEFREILPGCLALIACVLAIAIRTFSGRHLQRLLAGGLCFFLATFVLYQGYSLLAYRAKGVCRDKTGEAQIQHVLLVPGAQVYGWEPSVSLARRLDAALCLLRENPDCICVVSGGQGANEKYAEGEVIEKYLTDRGIDASRILRETKAENTEQNIRNSYALLAERGYTDVAVTVVSSHYHILRAQMLAAAQGHGYVTGYGASVGGVTAWLGQSTRDYMALWKTGLEVLFDLAKGAAA